jgi:hypothetical protein
MRVADHPHLAWGWFSHPQGQNEKSKNVRVLPWGWPNHPRRPHGWFGHPQAKWGGWPPSCGPKKVADPPLQFFFLKKKASKLKKKIKRKCGHVSHFEWYHVGFC